MLKELFTNTTNINTTNNDTTSTNTDSNTNSELEDIHEKMRKAITKSLSDAGFPNLTVTIGPSKGCNHTECNISIDVYWPSIKTDTVTEICEIFKECARNAIVIVFNEVIGNGMLFNEKFAFKVNNN